jgi:hypothetical protein
MKGVLLMHKLSLNAALSMFFDYFGEQQKKEIYRYILSNQNENFVVERLLFLIKTWKPQYGEKIPSIAEIIVDNIKERETAVIEIAWQEFKKNYNNHIVFEVIPDWIYTIRELMGGYELVDEKLCSDETWIKKEFIRIYPPLIKGMIPLKKDPMESKYIQIGNSVMIISENMDQERLHPELKNKVLELKANNE